eukprot:3182604-Rhodomonas_salina.1
MAAAPRTDLLEHLRDQRRHLIRRRALSALAHLPPLVSSRQRYPPCWCTPQHAPSTRAGGTRYHATSHIRTTRAELEEAARGKKSSTWLAELRTSSTRTVRP